VPAGDPVRVVPEGDAASFLAPLSVATVGDPELTHLLARLGVHRVSTGSLLFRTALGATVAAALGVTGEGGAPSVPSYGDVQRLVSDR